VKHTGCIKNLKIYNLEIFLVIYKKIFSIKKFDLQSFQNPFPGNRNWSLPYTSALEYVLECRSNVYFFHIRITNNFDIVLCFYCALFFSYCRSFYWHFYLHFVSIWKFRGTMFLFSCFALFICFVWTLWTFFVRLDNVISRMWVGLLALLLDMQLYNFIHLLL